MGVRIPIRLTSVDDMLRRHHGSVRQLTLAEIRVLEHYVRQMEDDIEDEWPVDTGTSAESLSAPVAKAWGWGESM